MVTVSTSPERAAYNRCLDFLMSKRPNIPKNDWVIYQSALRVDLPIGTSSSFTFSLYEVQGAQLPTDRKLNRNDAFFPTQMGLWLSLEVTGASAVPLSNTRLYSYPSDEIFGTAAVKSAAESFYNAKLSFKTVPSERIPGMDTQLLRYEPGDADNDRWGGASNDRGLMTFSSEMIYDGSQDNEWVLNLNSDADISALDPSGLTDQQYYVTLYLWGHRISQGAIKLSKFL